MSKDFAQVQNRRQLFAGIFRYLTLGLLGMVGGTTIAKRRGLVREGKCINRGICRGCEVFQECALPQALSAKENPAINCGAKYLAPSFTGGFYPRINNGGK